MEIEEYEKFVEEGNQFKNKKFLKINIVFILIGIYIIGLGYAGYLLPMNHIILEATNHHTDERIDSVWENENELVLVFGYSPNRYDLFNKVTKEITYNLSLDDLYDPDGFVSYGFGLYSVGYTKTSIFFYQILVWIRIIGFIIVALGFTKFFINPRRTLSYEEMSIRQNEATELAKDLTKNMRR
ncbi:MAG: hypothetical protein JEZ05_07735 [Tenericutes bacterium]|nr:hypothetical protein [Mycoplasmatota bacterium]